MSSFFPSAPSNPNLRLTILKAEGLVKKSFFKNPDPFVVVTVDGEQTCTTTVVKGTVDPYWGMSFDLTVRESSVLAIQVFDQKNFKEPSQGFLGVVNVLVSSVINLNTVGTNTLKFDLRPSNGRESVKGSLMLSLTTDISPSAGGLAPRLPVPITPSRNASESNINSTVAGASASTSSPLGRSSSQPTPPVAYDEMGALPAGWTRQFDNYGRPYYVDHTNRSTSWQRPSINNVVDGTAVGGGASSTGSTTAIGSSTVVPSINTTSPPQTSTSTTNNTLDQQRRMFDQRLDAASPAQNDLPGGWERRMAPNGLFYYIDHNTQRTTWTHPNEIQRYQVVQPSDVERIYQSTVPNLGTLPAGWEMRISPDGRPYYLDHGAKTSTWDDPRVPSSAGADAPKYKVDFQKKLREFRLHPLLRIVEGETTIAIQRSNMFQDAYTQFMSRKPIDMKRKFTIEFANEAGLDYGGVSREFFFLLSHEIFNPIYGLFQYSSHTNYTLQINPHSSINPEHLHYFYFIGRIIGTAIYQRKYLDAYFVTAFYKMLLDLPVTLEDMESIDADVYKGLVWMQENDVTDLGTTFSADDDVFGVIQVHDLIPDGRNIDVTNENKSQYIHLIIQWRAVSRVQEQITAIKKGLFEVIPFDILSVFNEQEIEFLFCGVSEIDVVDWRSNTLYRRYSEGDEVIQWFWKIVEEEFDNVKRAQLLQFATGTSRIPLNGFKDLQGSDGPRKFTLERLDDVKMLPRSHTCFNRIDLPPYASYDLLLSKLTMAVECSAGFDEK